MTDVLRVIVLLAIGAMFLTEVYREAYTNGYRRGNIDGWKEADSLKALSREMEEDMSVHSDYENGYLTDEEYESALATEYAGQDAHGNEKEVPDEL